MHTSIAFAVLLSVVYLITFVTTFKTMAVGWQNVCAIREDSSVTCAG
jgi:hypothetical protein